jgi:hypothetical protein
VQHERLFQLALDDQRKEYPPLKTAAEPSASDRLAREIEEHVREQILAGFRGPTGRAPKGRSAQKSLQGTIVGLTQLLLVVLAIAAIYLIVKAVF